MSASVIPNPHDSYPEWMSRTKKQPASIQVAERMKDLREQKDWTQLQVARRLGWSRAKVASIEVGARRVGLDDLQAIAVGFGITAEDLLKGILF